MLRGEIMKFIKKDYCSIDINDILYIVHDNNIVEKLIITKNHLQSSSIMKPKVKIIDNLYLASEYYEIVDDDRLVLNTLNYVYPDHSDIPDLIKDNRLSNVFVDEEKAIQFAESRKQSQEFHKEFSEYPKILIYNTQNDEVLGEVSTTNPLICLHEIFILTDDLKSQGFEVDIAVFDNKKYKLIKDIEILNLIRQLINNENEE